MEREENHVKCFISVCHIYLSHPTELSESLVNSCFNSGGGEIYK